MNLKQGDLENTILNALWNIEENSQELADVSAIQNKINNHRQKWAYTTVKTVLDRLVEKKQLLRYKQGRKYYYKSTASRIIAGESAIKKLIIQYYNDNVDEFIVAVHKFQKESLIYRR